jgi:hypothetical protein
MSIWMASLSSPKSSSPEHLSRDKLGSLDTDMLTVRSGQSSANSKFDDKMNNPVNTVKDRPQQGREEHLGNPSSTGGVISPSWRNNTVPYEVAKESQVPVSSVKPGPVWPMEAQTKVAYCYGIRRANGLYTILIPADELREIDIAQVSIYQNSQGMIILPPPGLARPEKRLGNEEMVPSTLVARLPMEKGNLRQTTQTMFDSNDATQVRTFCLLTQYNPATNILIKIAIDNIIANAPITPPRRVKVFWLVVCLLSVGLEVWVSDSCHRNSASKLLWQFRVVLDFLPSSPKLVCLFSE